jgi:hypothetical protein
MILALLGLAILLVRSETTKPIVHANVGIDLLWLVLPVKSFNGSRGVLHLLFDDATLAL